MHDLPNKDNMKFKVFELHEYDVEIDPNETPEYYKSDLCKKHGLSETDENYMRVEALLIVGRREYKNKSISVTRVFREGSAPEKITINEKD